MNYLSIILLSISFITYIYFGLYVFFLNPGSKKNRNFLYLCLAFFLWSFSYLLLNTSSGNNIFINKMANISRIIYVPLLFKFFFIFTDYYKKIKFHLLFNILIWIVPFIYFYNIIFDNIPSRQFFFGYWQIFAHIIFNIFNLSSIIILFMWGKLSKIKREKKQSFFIIFGGLLTILITIISDFISDLIKLPAITPALLLIWIFFIFYAVVKNQFLAFIPTFINQDIIDNINESIILLDNDKKIIYVNNKTKSIINEQNIENNDISKIIFEHFKINLEIDKLFEGKFKTFSCRINYIMKNKEKILVDAIFSTARDKYGDILGILIIGNEIKGLKQLKLFYKITERETEIIQELAEGFTNINIADHLGISENTLKRHIANIYIKLGINNKVELLNFLKDFNLVPNFKAEKTLLMLNKNEE